MPMFSLATDVLAAGSWTLALVVIGTVLVLVAIGTVAHRRRLKGLRALFAKEGWACARPGEDGVTSGELFEMFAALPEFNGAADGVDWRAADPRSGCAIMEHSYTVKDGEDEKSFRHVAALIACPTSWPTLSLTPETMLSRLSVALGGKEDIQLEDPAFNKRWKVSSDDENFAVLALSPQVQEELMKAPKGEIWRIRSGRIFCVRKGTISVKEALEFARRPARLLAMFPPELAAYSAPDAAPPPPA